MQISEEIYLKDRNDIAKAKFVDWSVFQSSNVLVTGATGLIGSTLIYGIMEYNLINKADITVIALVRNVEKAKKLFSSFIKNGWLKLIQGDVNHAIDIEMNIDYIVHGASETSSRAFVEKPVETILTAIEGTKNILNLAQEKHIKSMVYMSSMEVYGNPVDKLPLTEERMGYLNPLSVRSSYSESKQMVENMCVAYASEYKVPVKIVRLTQTFGPGVAANDGRVFAEFARCAVNGRNICLQTRGLTQRMYLYTVDAATALLTVLTKGVNGEAYNAANMDTYCSIKEMAEMVAEEFGGGRCKVMITIPETPNSSYNPEQHVYLDTSRLEHLGWYAKTGLRDMYYRMLKCM